ncbi:MAG TPA: hypothetical protein VJX66_28995 [Amycolatopsis sp.]|nr:hypothetical protein [Amycolatopsis sp.]
MTVLILAESWDTGASAVARGVVARRGPGSVAGLAPHQLATAQRWVHRVSPRGETETEIVTADGRRLDSATVTAVLNRIDGIPPIRFSRSPARDHDYAGMELHALFVSWLAGLSAPVLNPVTGIGPAHLRPGRHWLTAARRAGLPLARFGWSPGSQVGEVLVVGEHAHGSLAARFGGGCLEVARDTGCPLLEFRFARAGGAVALAGVSARPGLQAPAAAAAVAEFLAQS